MRLLTMLVLLLLGVLPALAQDAAAQAPLVKGTKVRLRAPKDFEPASRFSGYQLTDDAASIMVSEVPGPYAKTAAGLTKTRLASSGMTLLSSADVKLGDQPAKLLELSQRAQGTEFRKWMLAFGDERNTVLVVATWPAAFDERHRDTLRKAVLGARWDVAATASEALAFEIAKSTMLPQRRTVAGALLLMPKDVAMGKSTAEDPMLIVAVSLGGTVAAERRRAAAERALASVSSVTDAKIEAAERVTIADMSGWEHVAAATDRSGTAVLLYQVMAYDAAGYYRVFGTCAASDRETYLPEFRRLARTLRPRPR